MTVGNKWGKNGPSLDPLHMLSLTFLVRGRWRQILLVRHQTGLLLGNGGLVMGGLVVARARKAAAVVLREKALSTDELAPQADEKGADDHTEDRDADTSDDTNQDRQDDVRGELAEEQRPAVLAVVVGHVARVLAVVVRVRVSSVSGLAAAHHTRTAVHLHLLELGGDDGAPLANEGRALLLLLAHWARHGLGGGLLDLGDEELVLGRLDQVYADIGQPVDEHGPDLDDLQVDDDKVETLVGGLGHGMDLQAEAELLLDGLGLPVMGSELVVALESLAGTLGILVVLVAVLVLLVVDLGGDKNVRKWVGVGIQLKAVDRQSVGVGDGEVELEVAAVLLVVLLGLAVVLLEDGWASCTLEADGLRQGGGESLDGNGIEGLDFVSTQLRRDEERVGDGRQTSHGDEGS